MAMIGRNAAVAEIGPHRHQLDGPDRLLRLARACTPILLSGAHSRVDAFLNWADDYFHHDRAADSSSRAPPAASPGPTTRRTARSSTRDLVDEARSAH